MNLNTIRRLIVFFAALVIGLFLGAIESEAQPVPRGDPAPTAWIA
jgi:hypothetical protein